MVYKTKVFGFNCWIRPTYISIQCQFQLESSFCELGKLFQMYGAAADERAIDRFYSFHSLRISQNNAPHHHFFPLLLPQVHLYTILFSCCCWFITIHKFIQFLSSTALTCLCYTSLTALKLTINSNSRWGRCRLVKCWLSGYPVCGWIRI